MANLELPYYIRSVTQCTMTRARDYLSFELNSKRDSPAEQ